MACHYIDVCLVIDGSHAVRINRQVKTATSEGTAITTVNEVMLFNVPVIGTVRSYTISPRPSNEPKKYA